MTGDVWNVLETQTLCAPLAAGTGRCSKCARETLRELPNFCGSRAGPAFRLLLTFTRVRRSLHRYYHGTISGLDVRHSLHSVALLMLTVCIDRILLLWISCRVLYKINLCRTPPWCHHCCEQYAGTMAPADARRRVPSRYQNSTATVRM